MTKYLLSDGNSTTDIIKYLRDCLILEFSVPKNSIPYYTYGSDKLIQGITTDGVETYITGEVQNIINDIRTHNKDANLTLSSVTVKGSIVEIGVNVNGENTSFNLSV